MSIGLPCVYVRSIPAPAGEPLARSPASCSSRVYPRACGGTEHFAVAYPSASGLSPRLRGNPLPTVNGFLPSGSIPAPAGEPSVVGLSATPWRVYPRACGGTCDLPCQASQVRGLSPRLRGNPVPPGSARTSLGSIPAPAGEPIYTLGPIRMQKVYPRACGGTLIFTCLRCGTGGLSPRLRGNRMETLPIYPGLGSIPAPAGEPTGAAGSRPAADVYPRACGGTQEGYRLVPPSLGLSPRLRGNRYETVRGMRSGGSIPAPAGEPLIHDRSMARCRVYPRACGGTRCADRRH